MTKAEATELALMAEKLRCKLFTAANSSATEEESRALRSAEAALWLTRKALNSVATGNPMTVGEFAKITETEV